MRVVARHPWDFPWANFFNLMFSIGNSLEILLNVPKEQLSILETLLKRQFFHQPASQNVHSHSASVLPHHVQQTCLLLHGSAIKSASLGGPD